MVGCLRVLYTFKMLEMFIVYKELQENKIYRKKHVTDLFKFMQRVP